jgi:hypothetical protein
VIEIVETIDKCLETLKEARAKLARKLLILMSHPE